MKKILLASLLTLPVYAQANCETVGEQAGVAYDRIKAGADKMEIYNALTSSGLMPDSFYMNMILEIINTNKSRGQLVIEYRLECEKQ